MYVKAIKYGFIDSLAKTIREKNIFKAIVAALRKDQNHIIYCLIIANFNLVIS
ncbi:hypothetical protein GCM10009410_04010 [Shewanella ulleungensis]|uniref:Uncharacterized protein n=1 Tax=Shewanella ulleungensis TaxID=2282699 RepID=A0ABQ2QCB6_9GAMM|nr:hypothetical protein GCM10009410_04010 [Shewanella ulleungensis]